MIAQKQLEVVHTLDGKEYITPAQISKEMRDELHVRGGKSFLSFFFWFFGKGPGHHLSNDKS